MQQLIQNEMNWKWDYIINLSESDYPLRFDF
jgi:macrodomain Ter protein organizer (MatP/YcbG family)